MREANQSQYSEAVTTVSEQLRDVITVAEPLACLLGGRAVHPSGHKISTWAMLLTLSIFTTHFSDFIPIFPILGCTVANRL